MFLGGYVFSYENEIVVTYRGAFYSYCFYENHTRGNNISAAGTFENNMYENMLFMNKSSFIKNHKRGNDISTAGAFYKRMYNDN